MTNPHRNDVDTIAGGPWLRPFSRPETRAVCAAIVGGRLCAFTGHAQGPLGWGSAELVDARTGNINTDRQEASPFIVEYDDRTVELYFLTNRADGLSSATPDTDTDIYMTTRRRDGSFGAVLLVAGVNTAADDSRPNLRRDGLEMFFDSDRSASQGTDIGHQRGVVLQRRGPNWPLSRTSTAPAANRGRSSPGTQRSSSAGSPKREARIYTFRPD